MTMATILVVAPFLFAMEQAAAVHGDGTRADGVGLLQTNLVAEPAKQELRLDVLVSEAVGVKPRKTKAALLEHNRWSLAGNSSSATKDCANDPMSCLGKIKCPVMAALVKNGVIQNPTNISFVELQDALKTGIGAIDEEAFILSIDGAMLGNVDLFNMPSNHIFNTGIRSKGFVNETAFEAMWDQFHSVRNGTETMCMEDMDAAGRYFRQLASDRDPGLDFRSWTNWSQTVYGKPDGREAGRFVLLGMIQVFGEPYSGTPYGTRCMTKPQLKGLYINNELPPHTTTGMSRLLHIIWAGMTAGRAANAKWHIPIFRQEYLRRQREGLIPQDVPFNNLVALLMWIVPW